MVRKYKIVSFWYFDVIWFCRLQAPTLRQQFSVESALVQAFFVVPMHERFHYYFVVPTLARVNPSFVVPTKVLVQSYFVVPTQVRAQYCFVLLCFSD